MDELRLSNFPLLETTNVSAAAEMMRQVYCDLEIDTRRQNEFRFQMNAVGMGRVTLTAVGWSTPVVTVAPHMDDCFNFSSITAGAATTSIGRDAVDQDAGCAAVMSPHRTLDVRCHTELCSLNIRATRSVLEAHLESLIGRELESPLEFEPAMPIANTQVIWQVVEVVCNELERDAGLLRSPLVAEQYSEALLTSILFTQPHSYFDALEGTRKPAAPFYVRAAEEYIEAHCAEPITAADLARAIGVGVSTLYNGFRAHRNQTPMSFLRAVRLRRARGTLLTAAPDARVREIARAWGFNHVGRFASLYKKTYGETPLETLKQR